MTIQPRTNLSDCDLLKHFARTQEQSAFAELWNRHYTLVYTTCRRETNSSALAEDATQAVFLLIAQRAGSLQNYATLGGWLWQTARLTSRTLLRGEARRQTYETQAAKEIPTVTPPPAEAAPLAQLEPYLNDALAALSAKEREAVLLRFLEERTYGEIAQAVQTSENAARMRVDRALKKIRTRFARLGIVRTSQTQARLQRQAAGSHGQDPDRGNPNYYYARLCKRSLQDRHWLESNVCCRTLTRYRKQG